MSCTQGVQGAEELDSEQRKFFESYCPEGYKFTCLVWDTTQPDTLYADYYKDENVISKRFRTLEKSH